MDEFSAFTLWFTGISGAGKTTLSTAIEKRLVELNHRPVRIDGDVLRKGLNRDLGFSAEDRTENIRRISELANFLNDSGIIVICACITPFEKDRCSAENTIGEDRYVEVFLDCQLDVCARRDVKGLYNLAKRDLVKDFTGMTSPYEIPDHPDITLKTAETSIEDCVERIWGEIVKRFRNRKSS